MLRVTQIALAIKSVYQQLVLKSQNDLTANKPSTILDTKLSSVMQVVQFLLQSGYKLKIIPKYPQPLEYIFEASKPFISQCSR